jgi:WD40 repeat protein
VHLIRGDLDWIVMKCLEKDRGRRFETANGLAMDLLRHLNNEPVTARPPSNAYRFQKMVRRNKLAFAAGAAVAVVVLIGLAVSTFLFIQERRAHGRALAAEYEQSQLRKEAEAESKKAKSEAQRAEAAASEVKTTMAASDFSLAVRLIAEDDQSEALAYLARSLSLNPTNDAVATRLATLLASQTWWVPMRSIKTGTGVYSARFSPDGKRIVTSSDIGIARVWDAASGQALTEPMEPHGQVEWLEAQTVNNDLTEALKRKLGGRMSLAQFSPDGTRIITASPDRTVRQWDALSGQPLTEPLTLAFKGIAWSAQFSPDGRRIVVATLDKTVRVWDAQTGQSLAELKTGGGITSVQFSPDGERIITGSTDRTAQVWDAQNGQPLTGPLKLDSPVIAVQFSRDGKQIVTGSADGTARAWDAQSGQPLTGPLKHSGFVLSVQFSQDGKRIVTGSDDGSARVWDAQSGQPLTGPLTHSSFVHSAQFSPDGKRILTISANSLYLWEPVGGPSLPESFETDAYAQFSQDGKRLLTSHFVNAALTARVWDVESGQPLSEPFKPGASERASVPIAQFSPDGNRIVMISEGRTEQIAPDGNKVIKVFADQTARVWDARSGQPVTEPLEHSNLVQSAQFSPDGTRVVTASWDRTARVWNALTGQSVSGPLKHDSFVNSARFNPDGSRIVTASKDKTARVWDAQTGQPLTEPIKHGGAVESAQFSPDGKRIVTGSSDGSARVWDAQSGQPLTGPLKHSGAVLWAAFSPDGRRIATSSADGTARVWDAQTGEALTPPLKHGNIVLSAQFSRDGKRVVTASWDRTARVWDAQSGQPLIEPLKHGNTVFSAQFSPDGKRIFTTSMSDAARVWDLSPSAPSYPDWLLQLAEVISGETLNHQGMLEATKFNRGDILNQIRQRLTQESDDDQWVRWGRWFLGDPATRTISPFSRITVSEYNESRIKEGSIASLAEAERLASGDAKLSERIAEARGTLEQKSRLQKLWQEADALAAQGKFTQAQPQYAEALDLSGKLNGREHPLTLQAMANLANVYFSLGHHREAIALLQKVCEVNTKDTLASLALATWQTWFGQDADYGATCRRLVQQAQGTDEPWTAERAAKAACLQPSADAAMLTNALKLAQRAVQLGKGSSLLPWYQLCLGLTEYRIGEYADAEETLTIAEHTAGDQHEIQGTARLFRAMSLFRQSRIEEARKLFSQEAAQMPPLPKDEGKPVLDGRPVSHDVLIWWLAYKEAKSALNQPVSSNP